MFGFAPINNNNNNNIIIIIIIIIIVITTKIIKNKGIHATSCPKIVPVQKYSCNVQSSRNVTAQYVDPRNKNKKICHFNVSVSHFDSFFKHVFGNQKLLQNFDSETY
jgi:hypothetical protein